MNYYKRHLGDYLKKTSHLSLLEHGIYTRLLDVYYTYERPIEADQAARMIGARAKDEIKAVSQVLKEFFTLSDGAWSQKRCDEELAGMQTKGKPDDVNEGEQPEKSSKAQRQQRYRERRKLLFEALRFHGVTLPFDTSTDELQDELIRITSPDHGKQSVTDASRVTHAVTPTVTQQPDNVTANHKPIANSHKPLLESKPEQGSAADSDREDDDRLPPRPVAGSHLNPGGRAIGIATLLTGAGVTKATAFHPDVAVTWSQDERVTDMLLLAAISRARETKGADPIPVTYLKPIIVELLNPPAPKPGYAPPTGSTPAPRRAPQGMDPKGLDESYEAYTDRINKAEAARRKGQAQ